MHGFLRPGGLYLPAVIALALVMVSSQAPAATTPRRPGLTLVIQSGSGLWYDQGLRYEAALGVPRDYQRAAGLFCKAARLGNGDAAFHLATLFNRGLGVKQDREQATSWFRFAASRGNRAAMTAMANGGAVATVKPQCVPGGDGPMPVVSTGPMPQAPVEIARMVQRLAPNFGLDPKLVLAVMAVESRFRADAVSSRQAQGLMQLIPDTAARFGVVNPFDQEQNLIGGMKYLRWLLAYFAGDVTRVLAAYNAGEGAVDRYNGVPPFDETQRYVAQIRRLYPALTHPYQPNLIPAATAADHG